MIWPKYQDCTNYFHIKIYFQLCIEQNYLLPFIFSHIFDLLNASKVTSQLILNIISQEKKIDLEHWILLDA